MPRRLGPRLALAGAVLAAGGLLVRPAPAQPLDPAAATELFERGRAALKLEHYEAACADFADSERFDPKVGTLLNLAECEEHLEHLVSARAHWQQAADLAHSQGDARESVAAQHFASLDPRVPKLTVRLRTETAPLATVRRDGVELGPASLGVALPVDPGSHTVLVSTPGHYDGTFAVTLKEGESSVLTVGSGITFRHPTLSPAGEQSLHEGFWSTQKTLALVAAGIGVAGAVVGIVFGTEARANNDASQQGGSAGCNRSNACGAQGLGLRDDALRDGNIATAAFIVGAAGLVTGSILWLTAPRSDARPTRSVGGRLGIGPSSIVVEGTW
jgi:hypothetical protein